MAKLRVTAGLNELLSLVTFFAAAKKVTPAPGRGSANKPPRKQDSTTTKQQTSPHSNSLPHRRTQRPQRLLNRRNPHSKIRTPRLDAQLVLPRELDVLMLLNHLNNLHPINRRIRN